MDARWPHCCQSTSEWCSHSLRLTREVITPLHKVKVHGIGWASVPQYGTAIIIIIMLATGRPTTEPCNILRGLFAAVTLTNCESACLSISIAIPYFIYFFMKQTVSAARQPKNSRMKPAHSNERPADRPTTGVQAPRQIVPSQPNNVNVEHCAALVVARLYADSANTKCLAESSTLINN